MQAENEGLGLVVPVCFPSTSMAAFPPYAAAPTLVPTRKTAFPTFLLYDVLLLLPAHALARCRSVSTLWNEVIISHLRLRRTLFLQPSTPLDAALLRAAPVTIHPALSRVFSEWTLAEAPVYLLTLPPPPSQPFAPGDHKIEAGAVCAESWQPAEDERRLLDDCGAAQQYACCPALEEFVVVVAGRRWVVAREGGVRVADVAAGVKALACALLLDETGDKFEW